MTDRNAQPDGLRLPRDLVPDDEVEAEIREIVWSQLVRGDAHPDVAVEWVVDERLADERTAEQAFDHLLAVRRRQLTTLPDHPTNLDRAFDRLADLGIVARQDFTCCGTCGAAEIADERDDSRTWRGYVFFHAQDTDALLEYGDTFLSYGAFVDAHVTEAAWTAMDDTEREHHYRSWTRALLAEATTVLEAEGLHVDWDGDLDRRVRLDGAEWFARV